MGLLADYKQRKIENRAKEVVALFRQLGLPYYGASAPIMMSEPYNGEKSPGELGTIKHYIPDFQALSARSWQAYTESDIAQLVINNYLLWVMGNGLKFKAEPEMRLLKQTGLNRDTFVATTESRFNLYMDSKRATNTRKLTFHQLVYEAKKHAIVGGDCLVVLDYGREEDQQKSVSARMIDSFYLQTPQVDVNPNNGQYIMNGVEINKYGEPIAYWVQLDDMQNQRIPAHTETGTLQAFLVYGLDYRVDFYRGLPLLSAVLETIKKLDRYKEATVGAAEERSKIPYSVEHAQYSTGEDPIQALKSLSGHAGIDAATERVTNTLLQQTASNIRLSTGKQVINMPIGATLKAPFDGKVELSFKEFFETNFEFLCATLGIPPEVALNKYTSSFSSSRGANKNWEHKVLFERNKVELELYRPFYNYWLEMEIYTGKVKAPGYAIAKNTDDFMVIESYQRCRFIGSKMPFIDPLKEAQSVLLKLNAHLITYEQACEELNSGNWDSIIQQCATEEQLIEKLGLVTNVSDENDKSSVNE